MYRHSDEMSKFIRAKMENKKYQIQIFRLIGWVVGIIWFVLSEWRIRSKIEHQPKNAIAINHQLRRMIKLFLIVTKWFKLKNQQQQQQKPHESGVQGRKENDKIEIVKYWFSWFIFCIWATFFQCT